MTDTHETQAQDVLLDRVAEALTPYFANFSDWESARINAREAAGAVLADGHFTTLAALFEGFGRLLSTSSRDWGQYAPDAWLWAVICGWDCEETTHSNACVHGAMEEMQQRHGWSDEAVAKARRYRAAVRALTEPAVEAGLSAEARQQPDTETRTSWLPGPVALARAAEWAAQRRAATVDPAMCPRCKGDNQEAFELCAACAAVVSAAGPGQDGAQT